MEAIAAAVRKQFEQLVATDDHIRYQWEIVDLILANLVGAIRFKLLTDPRGLDAINHFDHREWLRLNGASERAINSPFTRILYDMALAYVDGDADRPAMAAGVALRGTLRFFFCYRGAPLWKMRAGMGDVVFAPFYAGAAPTRRRASSSFTGFALSGLPMPQNWRRAKDNTSRRSSSTFRPRR